MQKILFLLMYPLSALSQIPLVPNRTMPLALTVSETSGLETWNGHILTHNDSGKPSTLILLDTTDGKVVREFRLPAKNRDWEDITQDETSFYVADVGNNSHLRSVLKIYKVDKSALEKGQIEMDTISFQWGRTVVKGKEREYNYNCEAVVCAADSLFLFTKEKNRVAVFSVPKVAGSYIARYKSEYRRRNFFATGAWYDPVRNRLVICGYNNRLRTFIFDFKGFSGTDFFSVKPKRYRFSKALRQTEGITSFNGTDFYISNELLYVPIFVKQRAELHKVRLE